MRRPGVADVAVWPVMAMASCPVRSSAGGGTQPLMGGSNGAIETVLIVRHDNKFCMLRISPSP